MTKLSKTTSRIILSVIILVAVVGTTFLFEFPPSSKQSDSNGPVDKCGPIEPTDEDIQHVLSLGKEVFSSTDWIRSYTVEPYRVSATRHNDSEGAVAQIDYNIYTCGYTQADLDSYFSDENLNNMFADYESHNVAHFCEKSSLALYQFDLVYQGAQYSANFWVKQESDTRLLTMRLIFPKESSATLADYSNKIFPELTSCP